VLLTHCRDVPDVLLVFTSREMKIREKNGCHTLMLISKQILAMPLVLYNVSYVTYVATRFSQRESLLIS